MIRHGRSARGARLGSLFVSSTWALIAAAWCVPAAAGTEPVTRPPDHIFSGETWANTFWLLYPNHTYSNTCTPPTCYAPMPTLSGALAKMKRHPAYHGSSSNWSEVFGEGTGQACHPITATYQRTYSPEPNPAPAKLYRVRTQCAPPTCGKSSTDYELGRGRVAGRHTAIDKSSGPCHQNTSVHDDGTYIDSGSWMLYESVTCAGSSQGWWPDPRGHEFGCIKEVEVPPEPSMCAVQNQTPGSTLGGGSNGLVSNPIDPSTGTKRQIEVDYAGAIPGGVSLTRYWDGHRQEWLHSYNQRMLLQTAGNEGQYCEWIHNEYLDRNVRVCGVRSNQVDKLNIVRPEGGTISFESSAPYAPSSGANNQYRLSKSGAEWLLQLTSGGMERYDANGLLLQIVDRDGRAQRLTYRQEDGTQYPADAPACAATGAAPEGKLQCVTDWREQPLNFNYDAEGLLVSVVDPTGGVTSYEYNGPSATLPAGLTTAQVLTAVVYPGSHRRTYHYNEAARVAGRTDRVFLTGLTDERGIRIGSYGYDAKGRAIVTEGAGGVLRHEISYAALDAAGRTYVDTNPVSIAITYPNGSTLTRDYRQIGPYSRVIGSSQPGGAGCGAASQSIGYDAQGNVASETGFSGSLTCFQHDAVRNLRTARGEGFAAGAACPADLAAWMPAAGTLERKISTQWHPDHRLPTRESHPKRITTWVYNGQPDPTAGNAIASCAPVDALVDGKPIAVLCKQVEQATTDATGGAGFAATSSGAPRIWTYTYDKAGQRLASNGPRTDVNDIVTLAYYTDTTADHTRGDLMSITDETGLVTQYTKYNRRGQPLEMIAPNGAVTAFTYFPRGWLQNHSVQAGGVVESTAYAYDAAGHPTQVTLPDTSTLIYTYDDAGRLTRVADNAGNRIDYSFDTMGNVVGEESKDASGNLARRVARVYDQLNRVQQVMGDMQ